MGQTQPLFIYFCSFLTSQVDKWTKLTINDKSVDGVQCDQIWQNSTTLSKF